MFGVISVKHVTFENHTRVVDTRLQRRRAGGKQGYLVFSYTHAVPKGNAQRKNKLCTLLPTHRATSRRLHSKSPDRNARTPVIDPIDVVDHRRRVKSSQWPFDLEPERKTEKKGNIDIENTGEG